ncbi:hypothetical protein F159LOC_21440 [Lelliottia sp. F159]|uniref:hypothetical protein n=1 Tax=Lelliottia sp. F159 TaxID=2059860 RepID=UPI000C7EFAC0|nr:hypothetical protein [Lelliottia sp. F159]PLY42310.1 hypothetical protein F159LOC_21440 [Lelliottia sp. F159]
MKLIIELEDSLVYDILEHISANPDDFSSVEEAIPFLLNEVVSSKKLVTLDDGELDKAIQKMIKFAIENNEEDILFKASELYVKTFKSKWLKLSSSTRKSLGRRFRSAANDHYEGADCGDTVIEFDRRNINNAALYKVIEKTL